MSVDERAAASTRISLAAAGLLDGVIGVVAVYAAKGSEVDPIELDRHLRATGRVVAYPRIVGGGRMLSFHAVAVEELEPSRFGLREPRVDAPEVAVEAIATFVIPGLAFDREHSRIGWGRGHYDTTLAVAAPEALRLGLAFECQLVDHIPHEVHDVRLHHVITEAAIY
jgi:5-formyltetrahydrofolate cyclo-ligase